MNKYPPAEVLPRMRLDDPVKPWPPGWQPLTEREAFRRITTGSHMDAREQGRAPYTEQVLMSVRHGTLTCALTPDGYLRVQTTVRAAARYN